MSCTEAVRLNLFKHARACDRQVFNVIVDESLESYLKMTFSQLCGEIFSTALRRKFSVTILQNINLRTVYVLNKGY